MASRPRDTSLGGRRVAGQQGRFFEQFEVGMTLVHAARRTVTEADNVLFCSLTMNQQPLHLDEEFAKATTYGTRVVNSLFTLSLVAGLAVNDTTLGTTIANLGFESVRFPEAVRIGDTIRAETTVLAKRLSQSHAHAGIVSFRHIGLNQSDVLVCDCTRSALMKLAVQA
jgi:acyl dehydratase